MFPNVELSPIGAWHGRLVPVCCAGQPLCDWGHGAAILQRLPSGLRNRLADCTYLPTGVAPLLHEKPPNPLRKSRPNGSLRGNGRRNSRDGGNRPHRLQLQQEQDRCAAAGSLRHCRKLSTYMGPAEERPAKRRVWSHATSYGIRVLTLPRALARRPATMFGARVPTRHREKNSEFGLSRCSNCGGFHRLARICLPAGAAQATGVIACGRPARCRTNARRICDRPCVAKPQHSFGGVRRPHPGTRSIKLGGGLPCFQQSQCNGPAFAISTRLSAGLQRWVPAPLALRSGTRAPKCAHALARKLPGVFSWGGARARPASPLGTPIGP